jgi:hypothetical protein
LKTVNLCKIKDWYPNLVGFPANTCNSSNQ